MTSDSFFRRDIYHTIRPFRMLQKCLGMATFKLERVSGHVKHQRISRFSLYKITFYFVFVSVCSLAVFRIIALASDMLGSTFWFFLGASDMFPDVFIFVTFVAVNEMHMQPLQDILEKICFMDNEFKDLLSQRVKDTGVVELTTCWIALNFCALLVYYRYAFLTKAGEGWNRYNLHLFVICLVYKTHLGASYRMWLLVLNCRFKSLLNFVQTFSYDGTNIFATAARLLSELRFVIDLMTKIYSLPILLDIGCSFVMTIIEIFYFSSGIYEDGMASVEDRIIEGITIIVYGLDVITLALLLNQIIFYANQIKKELFKLMTTSNDFSLKREINAFSLQLLHDDVKITAGGFFTIDMPLIYTMIGAGTRYLIILNQFELAIAN